MSCKGGGGRHGARGELRLRGHRPAAAVQAAECPADNKDMPARAALRAESGNGSETLITGLQRKPSGIRLPIVMLPRPLTVISA